MRLSPLFLREKAKTVHTNWEVQRWLANLREPAASSDLIAGNGTALALCLLSRQ